MALETIPVKHLVIFNDAERDPSPIGTTADGTSIYPARKDHVHRLANNMAVLGSVYSLPALDGNWYDTGLSITLPEADAYILHASVRGFITADAGAELSVKLRNSTDGVDVTNSETLVVRSVSTSNIQASAYCSGRVSTGGANKVIKLYAMGAGTGLVSVGIAGTHSNGTTRLIYERTG